MAPPRRVSNKQIEILAEFAEAHQHIALGRYGSIQGLKEAREAWESIAVCLNNVGIKRTPGQWRRYWIEYKAKLKSKAADSRRGKITGSGGRLKPLTDREQQILGLINQTGADDPDASDIQYSPIDQTSSPESHRPTLEVEWLDYESDSDTNQIADEEAERSQSEEPQGDSEYVDTLPSADTEDEVSEQWKNFTPGGSLSRHLKILERKNTQLNRSHKMKELYQDRRRELKDRCSETSFLQNDVIHASSSTLTLLDQDNKHKKASLSDVTATAMDYFNAKKNKSLEGEDPDLLFFHSILPEMKQMTPDQKRQFKMGVWSLATQILEQNMDFTDHNYGLSIK